MFANRRNMIVAIVALIMLLAIGSMTRFSDATAKTVEYAKELAHKGQFLDAVIALQNARQKAKGSKQSIERINTALAEISAEKADFRNLPAALAAADTFVKSGHPEHALHILQQVQEAVMPIEDMQRLASAVADLQVTQPVAYAIVQAQNLARDGKYEEAHKVLGAIRKSKATTPLQADQIRRVQIDLEDQQRAAEKAKVPASAPTSSSGHTPLGSFGNEGVASAASDGASAPSASAEVRVDNRSFTEKVTDKVRYTLGLEEPEHRSPECART